MSGDFNPVRVSRRFAARLIAAAFTLASAWSSPALARQYMADAAQSKALTSYLREHRLPLVGAQVLRSSAGGERLMLYGFVATEYGKTDAQRKALAYLHASGIPVENRITVRPEIAKMKPRVPVAETQAGRSAPDGQSLDSVLDDISRYGVKGAPDESGSGAP